MKLFLLACMVAVAAAEEQLANVEPRPQTGEQPGQYYYPAQPYPYIQDRQGVGANAELSFQNPLTNPVDLSSYMPNNLITTMVYALGILSLVNLLLGLIPADAAEEPAAVEVDRTDTEKEGRSLVQPLANTVLQAISKMAEKYGQY